MNPIARWKIIVSLLVIFFAGAITGGLLTISIVKHQVRRQSDPARWSELTMQRWKTRLNLSAQQQEKLRLIVQETVEELRKLRLVDLQETEKILSRAQQRIEPELDAKQRIRLQKMREARKRRLQDWLNIPERRQ